MGKRKQTGVCDQSFSLSVSVMYKNCLLNFCKKMFATSTFVYDLLKREGMTRIMIINDCLKIGKTVGYRRNLADYGLCF